MSARGAKPKTDWEALVRDALKSGSNPAAYQELLGKLVGAAIEERDARDEDHAWDMFAAAAITSMTEAGRAIPQAATAACDLADRMIAERKARFSKRGMS